MAATRRRLLWLLLVPVVLVGLFFLRGRGEATQFTTAVVDRGDVVEVVGATGALEAVTTVQIGSQVSGTIQSLNADFNSTVKKGQIIARLDPSILDARLGQAQANLLAAKANVERARSGVEDMRQKYERAKELAAQNLLPASDLDTAKANYDGAAAELKASQAAESQSLATVNQARVDLSHTVIDTPIDGVVISRNVDVGQTVAASFQAPVLFVIANDLARMRVNASVDEADVGRVREGQDVTFHVDAFPEREFKGVVEQVRLNPTTVSNVVSYNTIIAVDNRDLLLRPGMTATVSIVVRKAENALRVPASALRFRPEGYQRPTGGTGGAAASAPPGASRSSGGERPAGGTGQWAGRRAGGRRRPRQGAPPAPRWPASADRAARWREREALHRVRARRAGTAEGGRDPDRRLRRPVRGAARGPRRGRPGDHGHRDPRGARGRARARGPPRPRTPSARSGRSRGSASRDDRASHPAGGPQALLRARGRHRARPARGEPGHRGRLLHRRGRRLGLRQVDPDEHPRPSRPPDLRQLLPGGPGRLGIRPRPPGGASEPQDRLRLPELQPAPPHHRARERGAAAPLQRPRASAPPSGTPRRWSS